MIITLADPTTNEILLDAAAQPDRAVMHTSPVFVRNLRHNSQFQIAAGSIVYRAVGSARHHREVSGALVVRINVIDSDGEDWGDMTFDLDESVHGVVGAI